MKKETKDGIRNVARAIFWMLMGWIITLNILVVATETDNETALTILCIPYNIIMFLLS